MAARSVPVSGLQSQEPPSPFSVMALAGSGIHAPRYLSVTTRVKAGRADWKIVGKARVTRFSVAGVRKMSGSGSQRSAARSPMTEVRR